jgi:hypothetical protein
MRVYIITSGLVFGLVVLAHVARLLGEGVGVARNPFFTVATVVAAAFVIWAWRLLRQRPGAPR